MIVRGCIGSKPEKKTSHGGSTYYAFRLAENHGKGESKRTIWYDVNATIADSVATGLAVGDGVEIDGRLDAQGYLSQKRIGAAGVPAAWGDVAKLLRDRAAIGVGLKLLTMSVKPHTFESDDHVPAAPAQKPTTTPAAAVAAQASAPTPSVAAVPASAAPPLDMAAIIAAAVAQAMAAAGAKPAIPPDPHRVTYL